MSAIETPITELTPVYTDPAVLQGKAVLVHDPTTGDGIVFDASKLDPSEKYQKPSTGIPKTDLAEVVQESLEKANTALQPEDIAQEKGTDEEKVMSQKAVTGIFTELQLKSGVAEGLADTLSAGTAQEITFRKSGGDGVNYMKAINGKTLAWNQLLDFFNITKYSSPGISGATMSISGEVVSVTTVDLYTGRYQPITIIQGHKYLAVFEYKTAVADISIGFGVYNTSSITGVKATTIDTAGAWISRSGIFTADAYNSLWGFYVQSRASDAYGQVDCRNAIIVDLTLMFGAGNEPSTVEEFKAMFQDAYYPYNAGTPISNDASVFETVGFNQWDEEVELGYIVPSTGEEIQRNDRMRFKNFMPVIGGATYYVYNKKNAQFWKIFYDANKNLLSYSQPLVNATFTVPYNAAYMRCSFEADQGTTYNHDICINLSDASKNGTHEPYWKRTINLGLDSFKVKDGQGNVPTITGGLKSAGSVHDEIVGNKYIKRIKEVDMGELNYTKASYGFYSSSISNDVKYRNVSNLLSTRFTADYYGNITQGSYKIGVNTAGILIIGGDDISVADFKTAMSGVMLYYELATPVEFELAEPIPNSILVDELGTERAIFPTHEDGSPSAPLCTDSNYSISVKNLVAAIKNINQA